MNNNRLEIASQQLAILLACGQPSLADELSKDSASEITQHHLRHAVRMSLALADELLRQAEIDKPA